MSYAYINERNDNNHLDFIHELYIGETPISLDTETTGLDVFKDTLTLLQVNVNNNIYIYSCNDLGVSFITEIINQIILTNRTVILHNAKFDLKFIYHATKKLITNVHDTQWTETLINAGIGETLYSLATLVEKYVGITLEKEARNLFINNSVITQEMLNYSALDVTYLDIIYNAQMKLIEQAKEVKVYELESKLVPVVMMMEYTGITLDMEAWSILAQTNYDLYVKAKEDLHSLLLGSIDYSKYTNALVCFDALHIPAKTKRDRTALELITGNLEEVVRGKFNFGSHVQMLALLNILGVPITDTNEKTLKDLQNKFEFIARILEFREVEKKNSTYGFTFLENINPVTGRVHTEYFNMGAATGRFSSNRPNLQNIPRDETYRHCFVAPEGRLLLSVDYSQQEFRLAGAVSGEKFVIDAYKAGKDMHTATAAIVFDKGLNDVTKADRNIGKTINFAILYGSTEFGLAYNLKLTVEKGKEIIDKFYNGYPTLASFKRAVEEIIVQRKYSTTPLGRRRYWKESGIFDSPQDVQKLRDKMKREGFNHVIQGGGADITKLALVKLFFENPFGDKFKLLLQVHDEIVAEIDESIKEEAQEFMEKVMCSVEQPFLGEIPAAVEGKALKYWSH